MTHEQWLSTILTAICAVAYATIKIIEYVTSRPRNVVFYVGGNPETRTVTPKGVDLDELRFGAGLGAWLAFIWALQAFGLFS